MKKWNGPWPGSGPSSNSKIDLRKKLYYPASVPNKAEILPKVKQLLEMHRKGLLGGEKMPEDENPGLDKLSAENLLYFTLPMALNYQRNSYKLWEAANKAYADPETKNIFNPAAVLKMNDAKLRGALVKYKVALQPNKHPEIWRTLCNTFSRVPIDRFFQDLDFDAEKIKSHIQRNKKDFPYLSGPKILNYWLYVLGNYTDFRFKNRGHITIAPDTHVIQASVRLGLLAKSETTRADVREHVAALWQNLLAEESIMPIDVHTPLWLWSRGGFIPIN